MDNVSEPRGLKGGKEGGRRVMYYRAGWLWSVVLMGHEVVV